MKIILCVLWLLLILLMSYYSDIDVSLLGKKLENIYLKMVIMPLVFVIIGGIFLAVGYVMAYPLTLIKNLI